MTIQSERNEELVVALIIRSRNPVGKQLAAFEVDAKKSTVTYLGSGGGRTSAKGQALSLLRQ